MYPPEEYRYLEHGVRKIELKDRTDGDFANYTENKGLKKSRSSSSLIRPTFSPCPIAPPSPLPMPGWSGIPPPPLPPTMPKRMFPDRILEGKELRLHAQEKLGIPESLWETASAFVCGGNADHMVRIIKSDPFLIKLLFYHPQQLKLFMSNQLRDWSPNYEAAETIEIVEEEVDQFSSICIFSHRRSVEDFVPSTYHVNLFESDDPLLLTLSKTLSFPDDIEFPHRMGCLHFGSVIYFVGGRCKMNGKCYSSKKVYSLDIADLKQNFMDASILIRRKNMNVGKSNPLVMAANGKIYVLSCSDFEKERLSDLQPFDVDDLDHDWSLTNDQADWYSGAFEVYDTLNDEWTILPLPKKPTHDKYSLLDYFSSMLDLRKSKGYAVVRDKLFFYSYNTTSAVYTFDVRTFQWKYYDPKTRDAVKVHDYYDSLAYELVDNGMYGRGLVVRDTLYAFSSRRTQKDKVYDVGHVDIWAYHIPKCLDNKSCHSGPVKDFRVECIYGAPISMRLQASLAYLRNGTLCCIHGKEIKSALKTCEVLPPEEEYVFTPPEIQKYFTMFKVYEKEADNGGKRCLHAVALGEGELKELGGSNESFLYFFAC